MVKRADAGEIVASQRVAIAQDDVAAYPIMLCQAARQLLNSILPNHEMRRYTFCSPA